MLRGKERLGIEGVFWVESETEQEPEKRGNLR